MSTSPGRGDLAQRWSQQAPYLAAVLRMVAAFLFIAHGTMKLFAFPPGPHAAVAPLFSQMWFAGVLETFGGALLLVGLFTRPVAFVLAGEMAVAYFLAHAPKGFWPVCWDCCSRTLWCSGLTAGSIRRAPSGPSCCCWAPSG